MLTDTHTAANSYVGICKVALSLCEDKSAENSELNGLTTFLPLSNIVYLTHLPPAQNGRHFADDIFRGIFVNEQLWTVVYFDKKITAVCS